MYTSGPVCVMSKRQRAPDPDMLKSPGVQLSFPTCELSAASEIAIGLCLFLGQESHLLY